MEAQELEVVISEMLERNDRLAHAIMNKIADLALGGVKLEDE